MPHSIDYVEIALSVWVIDLPWASREALVDELRVQPSLADIVKEFQAVGTSRPVQLTQPQKGLLVEAIEAWASQVEGGLSGGLPSGIGSCTGRCTTTCTTGPTAADGLPSATASRPVYATGVATRPRRRTSSTACSRRAPAAP